MTMEMLQWVCAHLAQVLAGCVILAVLWGFRKKEQPPLGNTMREALTRRDDK
jgi:hypothetical protein